MKIVSLTLLLMISCGPVYAQVGDLYDAEVREETTIADPAKAAKIAEGQWLVFSMPVIEGSRSPCCWKGKWGGRGEAGCSLEGRHQSYGTRSDSPLADNVIVYSEIRAGQVHDMRVVGEACPVDGAGGQVTWIGSVNDNAALDWLESVARAGTDDSAPGQALYVMAMHQNGDAGRRLYALAKQSAGELSEEAIFWLGEARGEQGFDMLERLLSELPNGESRRAINFALAQNNSSRGSELLFEISKSDRDPEQRGEAMFWLAEAYPQTAQPWLLQVIKTERDEDVLEQAVFAISQLPGDQGDKVLLELARNDQTPRAVRRQALFWLANSDNEESIVALTELLTR